MKRPQRNLTIIMTVLLAVYLLLTRLPGVAALGLLGALVVFVLGAAVWGRDLLIAHFHSKKKRFAKARERYGRFERKLLGSRWPRLSIVLYPNLYSFDGIALARNCIGQEWVKSEDLDRGVVWLRAALQRDPMYPVPYVNLALIAAKRGDATTARREMTKAVQLGFDPRAAHRMLQRALDEESDEAMK
jgi:hypothetical protein